MRKKADAGYGSAERPRLAASIEGVIWLGFGLYNCSDNMAACFLVREIHNHSIRQGKVDHWASKEAAVVPYLGVEEN